MNTTQTNPPSDILNEPIFAQSQPTNASELILIGILSYFSFTSILWTLDSLIKDLFIYFDMIPMVNFWIREIIYFGLFILIHFLLLKKIENKTISKKQIKHSALWLIGLLISTQVLQFVYSIYQFDIYPDPYMDHLKYFVEEIKRNQLTIGLVGPAFVYGKYLFIILLLMNNNKKPYY